MSEISIDNIIKRNDEIAVAELDSEIVMMNIEIGNYYNLGKMGSVIWNMLEDPISVETLILKLMEIYQVSRQQCEVEVVTFLKDLSKEGLIIIE